jgi:DNL zinc finger
MNQVVSILLWLIPCMSVDGWIQPIATSSSQNCRLIEYRRSAKLVNVYNLRYKHHRINVERNRLHMNDDDDDDDDFECTDRRVSDVIPQLPPIGSSRSSKNPTSLSKNDDKPFVANHKFQIQYTCNICETRNTNTISRLAYRQGVVIARCKGCQNQHLIADHLGWTNYEGGFQGNETNTIEDYFANGANNKTNVTVSRVNTDVFELEKILQYNTDKSGAIVSDDGKLALE